MIGLNGWMLYRSWSKYYLDGCRSLGWPLVFWEQCSTVPGHFYIERLVLDAIGACLIAKLIADLTCDGPIAIIHRARTWGTPWEGSEPEFRFSLRTLLITITVVAVLLGILVSISHLPFASMR